MNTLQKMQEEKSYRDKISTVDDSGKRVWIYPKKPKGKLTNYRTYVSWVLLAFLFITPFIKVNGEPFLLFNIIERKFVLFGILFTPQDFHLAVFAMLTFIVFIILFTVVYGRIFCGWICPQTIFMEMVFRKIEYWIEGDANAQKRLNKAPWTTEKILKKGGKQAIFFAFAVLIANTFLSYIIGVEAVIELASEPVTQNIGGFIAMILFSGAFYFVFSYMREQVCVAICPYGRLQGVLLDKNSIVIAYDYIRGEPRGKIKKNRKKKIQQANPVAEIAAAATATAAVPTTAQEMMPPLGDCIDCKLCVQVCPTGIDIRNGTQLECINCTACMDACDEVMEKIDRPKGLIRYDSENGIQSERKKIFTPRVIAYTAVLTILIAVNFFLLSARTNIEALILRTPGMLYQKVDDNYISNLYNYQIINKTKNEFPVEFRLEDGVDGKIRMVGEPPTTLSSDVAEGALFIDLNKSKLDSRKNKITVNVYINGELIDQVQTTFLGPVK